jgi:hypothetical protein
MAEIEINTLELVRRIRDEHYEKTKNMSMEELLQFYRREADAANAEAEARNLLEKRPAANAR